MDDLAVGDRVMQMSTSRVGLLIARGDEDPNACAVLFDDDLEPLWLPPTDLDWL